MRILTGKDRAEYEGMIRRLSEYAVDVARLDVHVQLLTHETKYFKERCDNERARADRAVDSLLEVRGFAPITHSAMPPSLPDFLAEDPEAVADIEDRMKAGDASVFAERR